MEEALFLFFKGLARQGPSTEDATLAALGHVQLPAAPQILDLGCGSGSSTLALAEALEQAQITSVDRNARALASLRDRAERRGVIERIETIEADFSSLEEVLGNKRFDLIWSEGALYALGWERALELWAPYLVEGGHLVASDCIWLTTEPSDRARAFWEREYPAMASGAELGAQLEKTEGWQLVETEEMPREGWELYYMPLKQRVALVEQADDPSEEMAQIAAQMSEEIALWEEEGEDWNYRFFVLRKG